MAADVKPDAESTAPKPRAIAGRFKNLIILAAIMLAEGGLIFFVTRMVFKSPELVAADEVTSEQKMLEEVQDEVEIGLPELNAFNRREGRLYLYSIHVTVRIRRDDVAEAEQILEARQATIADRFNTVVRSAETQHLNEPGLNTLRRQFLFELNRILGTENLVVELLIPHFFQTPADN
jgi:flagellar basal body-associated protein FliL